MGKSLPSFQVEDNHMKNISEYDVRQLNLMHEHLIYFENKQIELSSLIGSLEFLFNALESIDEEWERKFFNEITILETINALEIIKESGEEAPEIDNNKNKMFIKKSIENLKKMVSNR
jgi:hypothetical protein